LNGVSLNIDCLTIVCLTPDVKQTLNKIKRLMPYRNLFEKGQPVHVISRAVDERKIFTNRADCYRFIFQIYAANIGKPNFNTRRTNVSKAAQSLLRGEEISDDFIIKEHPPLVNILDFALNITHYHFRLLPSAENSMPIFMHKLNMGFAKYFNSKYCRKGSLFSSRYKTIPIESDFQSDAVSRYISVINPLDIYQPGWRENGLANIQKAIQFLEDYEFSSFPDKINKRRSKILADEEVLDKWCTQYNSKENYLKFVKEFLKQRTNLY